MLLYDVKYPEWKKKYVDDSKIDGTILSTESFVAGRSVGAMARRFYVSTNKPLNDGQYYIKEGSLVTGVKVIAIGKDIREVGRLVNTYLLSNGQTTNPNDWKKVTGIAIITNGIEERMAEVHWYQCKDIGKIEFKEKKRGGPIENDKN